MSDFEIESLEQLLAIALATERDAVARYSAISKQMEDSGNQELVDLFAQIAESERGHAKEIEKMVQALGLQDLPAAPKIAWQHPRVQDYRDRATSPRTSTPYLALAYAVNNEELAFRFYSYVAANAKDDEIRQFAETLAKEELSHAAILREQRRRAYHEQQSKAEQNTILAPYQIHSLADLMVAGIQIERRILSLMVAAENIGMDVSDNVVKSSELIEKLSQSINILSPAPGDTPNTATGSMSEELTSTTKADLRQKITAAAEQAFVFYDNVMVATQDEDVMLEAQELTQIALDRIDTLFRT